MATNKLTITLGFENNSAYTENITFAGISDTAAAGAKNLIKAVNASLAAGTDDGLADFFADEDENSLSKIVEAKIVTEEVTLLT